ncbi:MAG: GYDIA family GHMP kinase, partial [Saprospiraceae bacterium]
MLSGEYYILDGAVGLAVPTRFGQSMTVEDGEGEHFFWKSLDEKGEIWFEGEFCTHTGTYLKGTDENVGKTLAEMFGLIQRYNYGFLISQGGNQITTKLDFPRNWGLGSSSTLIYNLATWMGIDPFMLSDETLGGSGYDIACAGVKHPILYQLEQGKPISQKADFDPVFKEQLYFVHLGKKQNSRTGIKHYREKSATDKKENIEQINLLTQGMSNAITLLEFENLILQHETIIS